ncbi:DNA-binding domain-containing protein [Parabacteroides gordonii]|uniref:Uncharacterized protein n=1 Tax=Parabacteroides gordonii MS-1 = DSM 23371 TaxID=1203610 RepID=A0A0F5ISU4_9BACT|nr:DNA-binding domain-containing protein [Parabacteroides gordonii]KKB48395.1 hypothetical protein HMPREF1536_04859 [Parabacteroides gordonii MS-1 = DSM 23371]MCA5586050.1 DUF4469 domain-containing protein [Parabacteroides gordonii]
MQNKLRGWLADNSLTTDPKDRILVLESAGNAGHDEIYKEMREEDTGLRQETLVHVVTLYERIVARFLMNGFSVNTGLFHAIPRFTGIIEKGLWNPEKNGIYVSFIQDKVIREEITKTEIVIEGEKADVMYITGVEDRSNGMTDGSMTPGRNFAVYGAYLRVIGDDPAVGITFRNTTTDAVVTLGSDMFSTNDPGKLIFIVPSELTDGEYELTITNQYMKGKNALRKSPRSVSTTVFIGTGESGEDDRPVIE